MSENRYATAGWLAIVQAILFPISLIFGIIMGLMGGGSFHSLRGMSGFHHRGPIYDPSDILFVVLTGIGVYVLIMFRKYLNERYDFHDIDLLITLSIIWSIVFTVGMMLMNALVVVYWPVPEMTLGVAYISFIAVSMVAIGIIDIFIAVNLIKKKDFTNDLLKVFGYITLIAGFCELTVFLSPLAAVLLFPVTSVILGLVLLRANEEAAFV